MRITKYIPNLLTISRIIMSIVFVYYIREEFIQGHSSTMILFFLFITICASDFLDGKIARKTNSVSRTGAKLDVFANLFYIVFSYIALIDVKIIPLWFLGFIFLKFSEFVLTSKFIQNNKIENSPFVFDKVGRIVSASFLVIPGIVCYYQCLYSNNMESIFNCLLYVILIAGLCSSYQRIRSCFMIYKLNKNKYIN